MAANEGRSSYHFDLALVYLQVGRREQAREQFGLAVKTERQKFMKKYLEAEALINLYPTDYERLLEARSLLKRSIELKPRYAPARKKLQDLDQAINDLGEPAN